MKTVLTRHYLFILLMLFLMACGQPEEVKKGIISVIPQPNSIVQKHGYFKLNKSTQWLINDDEVKELVTYFSEKINTATGYQLSMSSDEPGSNFISINIDPSLNMTKEGYTVSVMKDFIHVASPTKHGLFYGLQTLLQLFPPDIEAKTELNNVNWKIPVVDIKDEPRFKWRGMHLDVCRHFVPVENIKKHLDMMAMFKMNTFHWHLTEDQAWRIEIKKYPLLTKVGSKRTEGEGFVSSGYYSQEEVKEIVKYAADRFITVVPEIELPGHALAALSAYPEYSCTGGPFEVRNVWGVEPDVFCAGKDETFEFLEDVIKEVVALFPSTYFHIGGDECPKERWEECLSCQRRIRRESLKDEHELQSYFIKRIEKVLLDHGKKMIGWDEILEGGLAESAAVMSWRGEKGGIEAANEGHDVVMTPGNWCYLDHYQGDYRVEPVAIGGYTTLEESYNYEPVPAELVEDKIKHVLGTQGNVWTEYMYTPELVEYRVYPRLIALAEVNWTQKEHKEYKNFVKRLDKQLVRLDHHNINYHIPLPEGPVSKVVYLDTAKLEFSNTRNYPMVYTRDGTLPTPKSKVYNKPLLFDEDQAVNIATILPSGKMSKHREINVTKTKLIPATSLRTTKPGLAEEYVDGSFLNVSDLKKVRDWQIRDGILDERGLKDRRLDYKTPSAHVFTGFITIPSNGIYEFQSNLDQLFLANRLLIDNDGEVKRFSRNNTSVALAKGKHPIKLIYLNNVIGGWPQTWNGPKIQFRKMGDKDFITVNNDMYSN